jgi:hypothetical protein
MRSKIYKTSIVLAFLMAFAVASMAAETIAIVLKVKGKVTVQRGDKASSLQPKRGLRLQHGDELVTGPKSYAAIRFSDDASLVRIRSNSTCRIQGKKEKNEIIKNVYLEAGTIFARVTQQKGKFEISTPTSVASVKGTEWIAEQRLTGGTFYYGLEGVVEITNEGGTALLHKDETGYVASSSTAPTVQKTKSGTVPKFDEFGEDSDLFEFEFENDEGQKKILQFESHKVEE